MLDRDAWLIPYGVPDWPAGTAGTAGGTAAVGHLASHVHCCPPYPTRDCLEFRWPAADPLPLGRSTYMRLYCPTAAASSVQQKMHATSHALHRNLTLVIVIVRYAEHVRVVALAVRVAAGVGRLGLPTLARRVNGHAKRVLALIPSCVGVRLVARSGRGARRVRVRAGAETAKLGCLSRLGLLLRAGKIRDVAGRESGEAVGAVRVLDESLGRWLLMASQHGKGRLLPETKTTCDKRQAIQRQLAFTSH